MFTSKFIIRGAKKSLKLRIFLNRKMTELSVPGIFVTEEVLADAMSQNPKSQNSQLARCLKQWDSQILGIRMRLLNSDSIKKVSLSDISAMLKEELFGEHTAQECEPDKQNWGRFYTEYVSSKKNRSYRESCQYTLNKMREHCDNFSDLKFEDITLKWLRDFDEKLIEDGASQNTRNIHFKNIRTCLNRAIDEELTTNYPFRRFKIRPEETRKRNLPVEELRRLFNYDVEPYQEIYRDMFKLIFMFIGINTIDLFGLVSITKDGRIEYKRSKTKKLYSIKVEPEALEIIDKYRGQNGLLSITDRWSSHRDFQKYCNIALKKIGKMERKGRGGKKEIKPEWPDLSTYFARYSWATIAFNDCGIPKDVISQALGHSWGASVTEVYLNRDQRLVDEANRRVLDWVLYGKR